MMTSTKALVVQAEETPTCDPQYHPHQNQHTRSLHLILFTNTAEYEALPGVAAFFIPTHRGALPTHGPTLTQYQITETGLH
jgi:hypothetical protein